MKILRQVNFSVAGKAKLAERAAKKRLKTAVDLSRSIGVPEKEIESFIGEGGAQRLSGVTSIRIGRAIGKDVANHEGVSNLHDIINLRGRHAGSAPAAAVVSRFIPNAEKPAKIAKRLGVPFEGVRRKYDHGIKDITAKEKIDFLKKVNIRNLRQKEEQELGKRVANALQKRIK